ncbi:hypothetical protein HHS_01430 [Candidatus Pantoea carbekii]|uniref:Uncharacterized protein n=1 Tax=Candidatus Pantoea carbekii TaxID=1235990 RepID=U3U8X4_9GAMM|nr:hypothetical protein HHS_01430 [Candidatus Pantoea carbekii]
MPCMDTKAHSSRDISVKGNCDAVDIFREGKIKIDILKTLLINNKIKFF